MGRIQDAVVLGARTVRSMPLPAGVYRGSLREARRPLPPGGVQKRHAVDLEMIDRTRTVWLDRHRADRGVIVHLPGGAYVSGPFRGDWQWLSRQADALQCAALLIDYRHAPDHPHPTALEDVEAVLATLTARGVLADGAWVLSGVDAGGGLATAAVQRARDAAADDARGASADDARDSAAPRPVAQPGALVLMTPWLDLTMSTTTLTETAGASDPVHVRRLLRAAADAYAGRTSLEEPSLSPISADMAGLPPVHLSVGAKDILATDVRVVRLQLEEAGVDVRYRETRGHLWMITGTPSGGDAQRLFAEQQDLIGEVLPGASNP